MDFGSAHLYLNHICPNWFQKLVINKQFVFFLQKFEIFLHYYVFFPLKLCIKCRFKIFGMICSWYYIIRYFYCIKKQSTWTGLFSFKCTLQEPTSLFPTDTIQVLSSKSSCFVVYNKYKRRPNRSTLWYTCLFISEYCLLDSKLEILINLCNLGIFVFLDCSVFLCVIRCQKPRQLGEIQRNIFSFLRELLLHCGQFDVVGQYLLVFFE